MTFIGNPAGAPQEAVEEEIDMEAGAEAVEEADEAEEEPDEAEETEEDDVEDVGGEGDAEDTFYFTFDFDSSYDDHVRECVFHCMTVGDADKYGGRTGTDGYTEKILGQTESMEYLFTYGDDGILKSYDVSGVHYEVLEYREGIGKLQLPDNVRTAIENKDLYG